MLGLRTVDYVMIISSGISLTLWLIFFFLGLKHNKMFENLEEKEFPLKEIYGLGYSIVELFNYSYKRKIDRKLKISLEVLYGSKYCEYYLRVVHAQRVTISFTLFVFSFVLYGFSSEFVNFFVGILLSGLAYYYYGTLPQNKIEKRSREMLRDFSEVVSKLALLSNAGMILRESWQDVAYSGKGLIYTEMQLAVEEMENGIPEIDAIHNFGIRCVIPEVKKFTSTIAQGMTKGNSEITRMLEEQSKEVWNLKKQMIRRDGEKASGRLLIPISIMFVGILIMILIPIFSNIGI